MLPGTPNLRHGAGLAVVHAALRAPAERDDFRVVHYSVQVLAEGWRRAGLIRVDEVPSAAFR